MVLGLLYWLFFLLRWFHWKHGVRLRRGACFTAALPRLASPSRCLRRCAAFSCAAVPLPTRLSVLHSVRGLPAVAKELTAERGAAGYNGVDGFPSDVQLLTLMAALTFGRRKKRCSVAHGAGARRLCRWRLRFRRWVVPLVRPGRRRCWPLCRPSMMHRAEAQPFLPSMAR